MGYMRGMQNQDLADQFRDQSFKGNQLGLQSKMMENQQSELMNPLLVDQQRLVNTGKGLNNTNQDLQNQDLTLNVGKKSALQSDSIEAERAALRTKLGDEKFNQLSLEILKDHMENIKSGDVVKIDQTGKLLDFLGGGPAGKAADRSQQRNLKELDVLSRQMEGNANRESAERIAEIRRPVPKAAKGPEEIAAKLGYEKGAAYYLIKAEEADTPEDELKFRQLAAKFEQLNLNARGAAAGVNKPDLNALGVETLKQPTVIQPGKQPSVADMRKALKGQ